mgnify:FL=1
MKKTIVAVFALLLCLVGLAKVCIPKTSSESTEYPKVNKESKLSKAQLARPYRDPKDLVSEGSWRRKSEKKSYPKIKNAKNLVIRVSLKGNRVYIIRNKKVLYTMLSTAGKYHHGKSYTPTGNFRIKNDRDNYFFNYDLNEGARNWTSWDDNNVYLFHSVPTKATGKINVTEAKKLGKTQGSHGCIRLSLPDSKWFMENIPAGTKVIIKNN